MSDLEHSPLGGSAAKRFLACSGSYLLARKTGGQKNNGSEWSRLGTAAHEACAKAISLRIEPYELIGEEFDGFIVGDPAGISLNAIQIYFNECMAILANRKEPGNVLIESTISLPNLHPLLKGTVDFGFWSPQDGIFLRDYKNGEGVGVSAVKNDQLLYYAFLTAMAYDWLHTKAPRNLPVSLGIVQPNFYGTFEKPEIWETDLGYILDWGREILLPRMIELTNSTLRDEDFVPGDHCQFCPVLLECPKMRSAFEEYAKASEEFIIMLTDEELSNFYDLKDRVRKFMTVLDATVHSRLIGGSTIASAKLVEKRVERSWRDGAREALLPVLGDSLFEIPKMKSPAQVEKISSTGKEMVLEWAYKPESSGLTVAHVSDPRPVAKRKDNAAIFAQFTQNPEDMGF